jgi:hypothetical protein
MQGARVKDEDASTPPSQSRLDNAHAVPFFLRSWWVKDYERPEEISWQSPDWLTLPLFGLQSDPFCDAGNLDLDIN